MLLAIDPGTNKCGYAIFDQHGKLIDAGNFTAKGTREERCVLIWKDLEALSYRLLGLRTIACEEPIAKGYAKKALDRIMGMIELLPLLYERNYMYKPNFIFHSPMTVKKACGSGKLDKDKMAAYCIDKVGNKKLMCRLIKEEDWDATDAVAVGVCHLGI